MKSGYILNKYQRFDELKKIIVQPATESLSSRGKIEMKHSMPLVLKCKQSINAELCI